MCQRYRERARRALEYAYNAFSTLADMRHQALDVVRNMADCCEDKACAIDALRGRQSSTLKMVLGINAVMFIVELAAGVISGSTAYCRIRSIISAMRSLTD